MWNPVKFYRASNSILTAIEKPSEEIVLQLLYTNCIPTLTYACAIKTYPSRQMQSCNTAVSDALRRIFGYNRWESIRVLRDSFGYKSITDIFGRARRKFYTVLPYHSNSIVSHIARNKALRMSFFSSGSIRARMGQNTSHDIRFCMGPYPDVIRVYFGFHSNYKVTKNVV